VDINKLLEKTSSPVAPALKANDQRIGHFMSGKALEPEVVFIGFPTDAGVQRNQGRVGAAKAPDLIRKYFYSLSPDTENFDAFISVIAASHDAGDLKMSGSLEQDQENLALVVEYYLKKGAIPVVIGGGHETFFGHFLGHVSAGKSAHILNWDAHLDVRELVKGEGHSGSMFRQALTHESKLCKTYTVAGALRHTVSKKHLDFINSLKGKVIWGEELNTQSISEIYTELPGQTMVTFDIDAVDSAFAPGVSAPAINGLSPYVWLLAARLAGESEKVTSFDIVETNPDFDQDDRTSRLAALTIWEFLRGIAIRRSGKSSLPLSLDQAYKKIERNQKKENAA